MNLISNKDGQTVLGLKVLAKSWEDKAAKRRSAMPKRGTVLNYEQTALCASALELQACARELRTILSFVEK